jgi:hypothetical protein
MTTTSLDALGETLSAHIDLSKSRMETLVLLITGMIGSRTVNLSHVATERGSAAKPASTYRRFQRFFQHVNAGEDWTARLIISLLGIVGARTLCLDRTNWKLGKKDINVLVLAVVTRRHRVPLMWTFLDGQGSSSTAQRIDLMQRYLKIFRATSIKYLLADREFIGAEWMHFLKENNIPFVIRVKKDMLVTLEDGRRFALTSLLRRTRKKRRIRGAFEFPKKQGLLWLDFAAKKLADGKWLIVAASRDGHRALEIYRERWSIECLFGDSKTRGLNMEDTGLTIHRKLGLLLAIVAIAMAWSSKTAAIAIGCKKPPRKNHGYLAKSWFRTGFDMLRNFLRADSDEAFQPWLRLSRKSNRSRRVV